MLFFMYFYKFLIPVLLMINC